MYDRGLGRLAKVGALWRDLRRREREGHTPAVRALWELARLRRHNGVSPMYYLLAGLYRRELSWDDKLAYVGPPRLKAYLDRINPPRQHYLVRNKIVSHAVLATFGIPTPCLLGFIAGAHSTTVVPAVLRRPEDLLAVMDTHGIDTVCFKHVSGTRGRGLYKAAIDRSGRVPTARILPEGEEMALDELWKRLVETTLFEGYYCEGAVEQHPHVARFNPWSLNTARCWMVKDDDGDWFMYDAVLRMGRGKTSIDNIAGGGLVAPIDTPSGRLGDSIEATIDRGVSPTHPVTGVRFSGETLPMWDRARELCRLAAARFPYHLVAVDVGFGVDTPVIMELGATPDDHQLFAGRGFGPMLEHLLARRSRAM
jgi:hypothetical protein